MDPSERYKFDSVFRQLVDLFRHYLEENACRQFTPTELREAVMLAATMYEFQHIRPISIDPKTYKVINDPWAPLDINDGASNLITIFPRSTGERLRIKTGWHEAGKTGTRAGPDVRLRGPKGMMWTPILWDGEEDPDFHKTPGLEIIKE